MLYAWTPPSPIPALVPWLGLVLLLALRANRLASAWLIGLPLLAVLLARRAAGSAMDFVPSDVLGLFLDVVQALAFGLAALWLTGRSFGRWHRVVGFLGILGTLAGAGIVCLIVWQAAERTWETVLPAAVLLAFGVLATSAALSLAGLCCRRRYRPAVLCLWLVAWLFVVPIVLVTPFLVFAALASGGPAPWGEFLFGVTILAGVCLAVLLPFLVLSFVQPFFRTRLQAVLHLGTEEPAPMLSPAAPPSPAFVAPIASTVASPPPRPSNPEDHGAGS